MIRAAPDRTPHCGQLINARPVRAGVYRPFGANELLYSSSDYHLLAVKISTVALEGMVSTLLDAPVRGHVRFHAELDVRRGLGLGCARLVRFLASEIGNPTGLVYHPIVAAPIVESILLSLLHAVGHQYRDALGQSCRDRRCEFALPTTRVPPPGRSATNGVPT
ncbi:hypothetical protein [Paractinoplanes rishiriensis]|uniref:AraC-like ligand-binding domain-containing protein n=1 Tax=Paractinoplanes rishiriensis TaxID=1050105 RepID=UPI0034DB3E6E